MLYQIAVWWLKYKIICLKIFLLSSFLFYQTKARIMWKIFVISWAGRKWEQKW